MAQCHQMHKDHRPYHHQYHTIASLHQIILTRPVTQLDLAHRLHYHLDQCHMVDIIHHLPIYLHKARPILHRHMSYLDPIIRIQTISHIRDIHLIIHHTDTHRWFANERESRMMDRCREVHDMNIIILLNNAVTRPRRLIIHHNHCIRVQVNTIISTCPHTSLSSHLRPVIIRLPMLSLQDT